ncbi:MAG TPA: hypothetical protein VJ975_01355 [Candidatus Limnocylindria bacterium]|nr:hypothetical protein [Candidatus Limnocylindria bacterium]
MTNRTAVNRAGRVATLLAVAFVLFGALPVRAASSIQIDARALVGGRYAIGGWLAVSVTLVNDGEPTDGYLSASTSLSTVQRHVEMPSGARKVVSLYVQPDAFARNIEVSYVEPNGTVEAAADIGVLQQFGDQYATVGDAGGTLRPQMMGAVRIDTPEPISLTPADIPERPEPMAGLTSIVWAGDSAGLSETQRRSLERWVAEGGQLIVLGGPDWQARTAGIAELLPLESLVAVDGVPQAALAEWAGAEQPAVPEATVSSGTLRDDASALLSAPDGTILASMRPLGAGRVVFIGTDLATDEHRGWIGAPGLWGRVLPGGLLLDPFGGGFPRTQEIDTAFGQALNTLPALDVPPAELLLIVIVGYIVLIGPMSYVVLRRIDRRELAWVTAPILVVIFSASSFGIGRSLKGSDVIVNQISLIRSSSDGAAATVETYAGVYSPDRAAYDVRVDADALMGRVGVAQDPSLVPAGSAVVVEQGDPARLRGLSVGVFGFEGVRAVGVVEHEPALSVTWTTRDGESVGTVTNNGEAALSDVAWISSGGGVMIGDLEPGASEEFAPATSNLNGSSASDQVYGFGGFDATSEQQRQIQMRRQVVDALVGYGNVAPPGFVFGGGGRGPFVIGWGTGEGPIPITVDGQEAQRYATTVEVVAARPSIGTGEVTIQPHQMVVTVAGAEGDVSMVGPGTIAIGTGSATFGIALPLEASGLVATGVEIVVAPDPSSAVNDPGEFSAFWPDGYTVELRDPATGEWVELGDLNGGNRFEISDPAEALSATGRIDVRVSGALDASFGQPNVFVSARVAGVMDR